MILRSIGAVVLLLGGLTAQAPATAAAKTCDFYVSPSGGERGDGSEKRPWKSIEQARDQLRTKKNLTNCDVVVNVKAGDYVVDKTIEFTEADSGRDGHKITYRSADGPGKARLLGARPLTGWQKYQDNIYKTKVDRTFYTLFEDGARATTARHPNRTADDLWSPYLFSVTPEAEYQAQHTWLFFDPKDIPQEWDPDFDKNSQIVVWSGGSWSWFSDTIPLGGADFRKNFFTFNHSSRFALVNSRSGSRYFLQNTLRFLDQPGEYYFDFANSEVYYWPKTSIDKVMAPTVKTLVSLKGSSPDRRVANLAFDGLALQYSDFVDWYRYGWNDAGDSGVVHKYPVYDRQIELPRNRFGMITLENTRDIDLSRLSISDSGYTGVFMLFANERVKVSDSLLANLGGDGIKVEGGYPGEGDISGHHTITNTYIDHVGELVPGDASGIELMSTGHNTVSNVVVKHSARYGISLEVRPEIANADNYARGNRFSYIRLEETGLDSGDMGAFYTYGVHNVEPHPIDNYVDQMVIGDVVNDPAGQMPDSGTRGVHMDAGGCGFAISNVQVGKVSDQKYQAYQCNEVSNADWEDGFDSSKMEYDKIGVTGAFPYPIPA
ncbi:right-handed parallel beta-helix repeat-containing protein [Nonomuraea fuscirosea]|uniref:right-handed parallel beta-helix repeat-containing protein n=1 Tax=Nonomuraea fuscirosea TaxID=1291556 RepID=UPI002DD7C0F2|nr:right-handed parallel beta-helix repeat-containing protein [Nonomuraea fuscirosea]WSA48865.1 right-handed parallel beta-helix repeat-containing protein [Nonomuraea fuscirosea]